MFFRDITLFAFIYFFIFNFISLNVFLNTKYAIFENKSIIKKTIFFSVIISKITIILLLFIFNISEFVMLLLWVITINSFYFILPVLFKYIINKNLNKINIYSLIISLFFILTFIILFYSLNKIEYVDKLEKVMYNEIFFIIYMFILNIIGCINFIYYFRKELIKV